MLFVYSAFLAYALVLIVTLWTRRKGDPSFVWLIGLVGGALLAQFFLVARVLGLKDSFPFLIGLRLPVQLFNLALAYQFARLFMRSPNVERPPLKHLFAPVGLGFVFYFLIQWSLASGEILDPGSYELQISTANVLRFILLFSTSLWILRLFSRDTKVFLADYKMRNSSLIGLRLPFLKVIWWAIVAVGIIQAADFISGPEIHLWKFLPLVNLAAIFFLVHFALFNSALFHQGERNGKEKISEDEGLSIERRMIQLFKDEKLYLNPQVRVADVASRLGVPAYKVSAALGLRGTNFFEFVNGFRVEHARCLLRENGHLNLMGIGMDSGFNSKSVFNEAFKRATGLTPSDYKRKYRPDSGVRTSEFAATDDKKPS